MSACAESIRVMHPLFQADEGGSIPTSALQLEIVPIGYELAVALNYCWHRTLPNFAAGFIKSMPFEAFPCYGALFDGLLYAVAIWSNPVARELPQKTWLELRRYAIAPDRPRNTATRMLAVMTRLLHRDRSHVERFISYQDLGAHTGTIYRAAGWLPTITSEGGHGHNWANKSRPRPPSQSTSPKVRWEKVAAPPSGKPSVSKLGEVP